MADTETHSISADAVKPLDSQVGGHPGVMTTEGGEFIIKPALPVELAFYQTVNTDPVFARLRPFIPQCIGKLRLKGEVSPDGTSLKPIEGQHKDECAIMLENLAHPFVKPNILDIKLGTVLYDEFASQEKKERMENTARETTSLETGVRLTGFQVHDNVTGQPVNTPKSYGKTIKPSDLPDGIAGFFPVGSLPNSTSGLPKDTLLKILNMIVEDIQEIRDVMAELEIRMAGGSLLVIYEADWERVEEKLKKLEEEEDEDEDDDDDDDDDDEDEEEGKEGEPKKKKLGPPFVVKIIDFAHTHHVSGRGHDESVLKGIDTTLSLMRGRIEQISNE